MHYLFRRNVGRLLLFVGVLGLGIAFQSPLVRAQDGGGQKVTVNYSYSLDISPDREMARFCLGQKRGVTVTAVKQVFVSNDPDPGIIRMRDIDFTAQYDANQVSVEGDGEANIGEIAGRNFEIEGRAAGQATIVFTASFRDNPDSNTSAIEVNLRGILRVTIIPCQYIVSASTVWVTTMRGANVFISENFRTTLPSTESGKYTANGRVHWRSAINRMRGCVPHSHSRNDADSIYLSGEIVDDKLVLTFTFRDDIHADLIYWCDGNLLALNRYRDNISGGDLANWIVTYGNLDVPSFTQEFPLAGGTIRIPHNITHQSGTISGNIDIVITPIAIQ